MNAQKTVWFHGSPVKMTLLKTGSTITHERNLAEVFSHKPRCVCMEDDGTIRHDGNINGFLYIIDEPVGEDDVSEHPRSSMAKGMEWLTTRALKLKCIAQTIPRKK